MNSGYERWITIKALVDHDEYRDYGKMIDHRDPFQVELAWFEEGFRFHDVPYAIHPDCGERCRGKSLHYSPWYYPGGEFVTEDGYSKIRTRLGRLVSAQGAEVLPDNGKTYEQKEEKPMCDSMACEEDPIRLEAEKS